jgi:protein phosphatase
MGTTLTMAYVLWPRLYVVHAGDSRCYLLREGAMEQVTTDQTIAQKLVEQGTLTPDQARASRWNHVLWSCIGGGSPDLSVEVYKTNLRVGDSLLLCTDGLTTVVSDCRIHELLTQSPGAAEACRRLCDAANEAGGPDNSTVVVAHFRDGKQFEEQACMQKSLEQPTGPAEPIPTAVRP